MRAADPTVTSELIEALANARARTLALVAPLSDKERERVHDPLMSPLDWDLGHIAAYEDLWLGHRVAGRPLVRPDLAAVYDAFETPRAVRGDIPLPRGRELFGYLAEVREHTLEEIERSGVGDGLLYELVVRHELQHTETMLQTIALARLEGCVPADAGAPRPNPSATGLELVEVPAGAFALGAREAGFAYDNERPRHELTLPTYRIGRTPVSNATWLTFTEGGGYQRREWWSAEGWAWKEDYDISRPLHWTMDGREWRAGRLQARHPDRPVVHVSWFEADACARAHGLRLPREAEWEKAATWDQGSVGQGGALGLLEGVGSAWEWTASIFDGYPRFRAYPYREYSEVFFARDYRVLRGWSWATANRVASPTFRNWDHPERRQIFSTLRLASDA